MERNYIQYKYDGAQFDLIVFVSENNTIIELMFTCINSNITQRATLENKKNVLFIRHQMIKVRVILNDAKHN